MLYSAPKKEITALAVDKQGNIYAAGAGEKRGSSAPHGSGTGRPAIVVVAPVDDQRAVNDIAFCAFGVRSNLFD